MKLILIFLVSLTLLFISCAQESDNSSSSDNNENSTTNTAPATNEPVTVPDQTIATQPPADANTPQPVSPTLPGNLRQAAQQNEINQQLNIQPLNQQQPSAPAAIKTIGDEKTAHFICPNACKGSGADEVSNCPTCGTQYTHNTDSPWHAANQAQNPPTTVQPGQPTPTPTPANVQPVQNTSPLPPGDHNTSHYICPDRCVGSGALSSGKCPVCAKDYVHNAESEAHKAEMKARGQ